MAAQEEDVMFDPNSNEDYTEGTGFDPILTIFAVAVVVMVIGWWWVT